MCNDLRNHILATRPLILKEIAKSYHPLFVAPVLDEGENNEKRTTNENLHTRPADECLGSRAEGSTEAPPAEEVLEDAKPCETRQSDSDESICT